MRTSHQGHQTDFYVGSRTLEQEGQGDEPERDPLPEVSDSQGNHRGLPRSEPPETRMDSGGRTPTVETQPYFNPMGGKVSPHRAQGNPGLLEDRASPGHTNWHDGTGYAGDRTDVPINANFYMTQSSAHKIDPTATDRIQPPSISLTSLCSTPGTRDRNPKATWRGT